MNFNNRDRQGLSISFVQVDYRRDHDKSGLTINFCNKVCDIYIGFLRRRSY